MNICNELSKSLKQKGVCRTLIVIVANIADYWFDFRYGTRTKQWIEASNLEIKSNNKVHGTKYVPTNSFAFKKLMSKIEFPESSVFVDFGAGKGKVLMMAMTSGFKRVVGVEYSQELVNVAEENISTFKNKTQCNTPVNITKSDVTLYVLKSDENVVYFFDPFDDFILNKVLKNITESLDKHPRIIYLIYQTPIYRDVIERQNIFDFHKRFIICGNEYVIYKTANNQQHNRQDVTV